jgi:hypothetical protein
MKAIPFGNGLFVLISIAVMCAPATWPQSSDTDLIVLKADTPVFLRLSENLRTNEGVSEQGVRFQVTQEVRVGDSVLIAKGAEAWGDAEITAKGPHLRSGKVVVRMDAVYAVTGDHVSLRGDISARGEPGCMAFDCVLDLAVGIKGGDTSILKGTKVQAFVVKDISFDRVVTKRQFEEAERTKAMDRKARSGEASLHIYRVPENEGIGSGKPEVFWDGKNVARMPEGSYIKLTVKPGVHTLAAGKQQILVHVEGGEQYYVRVSRSGFSGVKLELIPSEQGEEESYPYTPEG